MIHEPDVALTDFALFLECGYFAFAARKMAPLSLSRAYRALAASSLLGGLFHGFFPGGTSEILGRAMWIATMAAIGAASLFFVEICLGFWKRELGGLKKLIKILPAIWILYLGYIVFVDFSFAMAIYFYSFALVALSVTLLKFAHERTKFLGLLGVGTMVVASVVQQLKIGIHPSLFGHNAVFHVIQGFGLWLLFLSLERMLQE